MLNNDEGGAIISADIRRSALRGALLSELLRSATTFVPSDLARQALSFEISELAALLNAAADQVDNHTKEKRARIEARWASPEARERQAATMRSLNAEKGIAAKGGKASWGKMTPEERAKRGAKLHTASMSSAKAAEGRRKAGRKAGAIAKAAWDKLSPEERKERGQKLAAIGRASQTSNQIRDAASKGGAATAAKHADRAAQRRATAISTQTAELPLGGEGV